MYKKSTCKIPALLENINLVSLQFPHFTLLKLVPTNNKFLTKDISLLYILDNNDKFISYHNYFECLVKQSELKESLWDIYLSFVVLAYKDNHK